MLAFVKQATGLGLKLAEIKEIIAIHQGGRPPCTHVHRLLQVQEAPFARSRALGESRRSPRRRR
ncbi:MAG: MerR family DNA-binding protein [Gammaproteobacteria bacterium]